VCVFILLDLDLENEAVAAAAEVVITKSCDITNTIFTAWFKKKQKQK
jgi:hypothetical protein